MLGEEDTIPLNCAKKGGISFKILGKL